MTHEPEYASMESLLDLTEPTPDWSDLDRRAMLNHLLDSCEAGVSPAASIRELLIQPNTAIDKLEQLKRLAKVRRVDAGQGAVADLWRVIYFAAIASADRRGVRLSELAPDELERGYEWVRNHDWVDTPIRELFR